MKTSVKVEGKKLIIVLAFEQGVDGDKDGVMAAQANGMLTVEVDGVEAIDELVKSSEFMSKLKEKLGM